MERSSLFQESSKQNIADAIAGFVQRKLWNKKRPQTLALRMRAYSLRKAILTAARNDRRTIF
jgi:hypothetical protein